MPFRGAAFSALWTRRAGTRLIGRRGEMRTITTSRLFWLGGSAAMMLLGLAGTASASPAVPEIDPGSAASGLALLAGAVLLLIERRRRSRR
ncbi:MYXO-CTERM sorting domain-containing protein [Candidatus Binatus sp.]|uniref:MYXO-CTERM sorting domain-containing protein n=1 Tax=Candidatus Binatus sp. TaxID=2811406 RepID=UPI003F964698